jgi:hypothetical protein
MRVKLNFFERILVKVSSVLFDLSFDIRHVLARKYDPNQFYSTYSTDAKCSEIVFSNEEESLLGLFLLYFAQFLQPLLWNNKIYSMEVLI